MKNTIISLTLAALVTVVAPFANAKSNSLAWQTKIMGTGYIYSVVDGDTIWLNVEEQAIFNKFTVAANDKDKKKALREKYKSVKMRIANINTDESVHRDTSRNTAGGKKASDYLKSIAEKKKADFICWDHGDYGRPICSVETYREEGRVDIGYRMISEGYSYYVTRWGKHPYAHKEYKRADN